MPSTFRQLIGQMLSWLLGRIPPHEPFAGVRVPRRKGPSDRTSSVALAEPRERDRVDAERCPLQTVDDTPTYLPAIAFA
jgi:hypothetical protein